MHLAESSTCAPTGDSYAGHVRETVDLRIYRNKPGVWAAARCLTRLILATTAGVNRVQKACTDTMIPTTIRLDRPSSPFMMGTCRLLVKGG